MMQELHPQLFDNPFARLICACYSDAPRLNGTLLPRLKHCKSYGVTSKTFICHRLVCTKQTT